MYVLLYRGSDYQHNYAKLSWFRNLLAVNQAKIKLCLRQVPRVYRFPMMIFFRFRTDRGKCRNRHISEDQVSRGASGSHGYCSLYHSHRRRSDSGTAPGSLPQRSDPEGGPPARIQRQRGLHVFAVLRSSGSTGDIIGRKASLAQNPDILVPFGLLVFRLSRSLFT